MLVLAFLPRRDALRWPVFAQSRACLFHRSGLPSPYLAFPCLDSVRAGDRGTALTLTCIWRLRGSLPASVFCVAFLRLRGLQLGAGGLVLVLSTWIISIASSECGWRIGLDRL